MKKLLKITAKTRHGVDIEVHGAMPDIMTALILACEGVMRELTNDASEHKQLKRAFIEALKAVDTNDIK
jgi:hypothetical protein